MVKRGKGKKPYWQGVVTPIVVCPNCKHKCAPEVGVRVDRKRVNEPEKAEYDYDVVTTVQATLPFEEPPAQAHGGGSVSAAQAKNIVAAADGKCACGKPATCYEGDVGLCDKCNRAQENEE